MSEKNVTYRWSWFALTVNEWERVPGMREYYTLEKALLQLGTVKEKYRMAFDAEPVDGSIRVDELKAEPAWVYSAAE